MTNSRIDAGTSFPRTAASTIANMMRRAIRAHGQCVIGLSGGSTPGPVYEELSAEMLDWTRVSVFLVDDRCVGPEHPDSNQSLIASTLLVRLPVQPKLVVPDTSLPPADAASAYGERLDTLLGERPADVVLLGMGPDGHIASLFPPLGEDALGPARAIRTVTDAFAVRDRISVTLPVLAGASAAVFLLRGKEKHRVWEAMLSSADNERRWPAKAVLAAGKSTVIAG